MKYKNYQVKDFVADAYFQKWVLAPDAATNKFWNTWLQQNPAKKPATEEAREIIRVLGFTPDFTANTDFMVAWQHIQNNISETTSTPENNPVFKNRSWFKSYQQMAAVLLGMLLLAGIILYQIPKASSPITYSTAYGQLKTFTLPDGSQVSLNANSTLAYNPDWSSAEPRQVWLTGEAYFKVVKKSKHEGKHAKFKVHTANLNVEVLGTQFNVNTRRKNTNVVLQSGRVKLNLIKAVPQAVVVMQPGDFVRYSGTENQLIQKKVNPRHYTAWLNKELAFNKTPLQEIAWLLEDNYGYVITFKDAAIAREHFTGTIPDNNIQLLLAALTKLYNLHIVQKQNHLIIASNLTDNEVVKN